ncbi:MAG TPA: hypothetical protein ENJ66_05490 [Calditrichae bacterium]|nr:hypothetical protein [Calditrichia bacterium]
MAKDFNDIALEFVKIYFQCHPDKLPEDKDKAFQEMSSLHGKYKNKLIEKAHRKSEDFFSDKL